MGIIANDMVDKKQQTPNVEDEATDEPDDTQLVAEVATETGDDAGISSGDESLQPAAPKRNTGLARRDPLTIYINETKRHPLLTRDEEHRLAVSYVEEGDLSAARKLVESNLRLVVKIAYQYRRAHRNLLDLIQEGNIGLLQAVRKYDPYRGVKLSTYAAWWIRAYILKYVLSNWRLVKIGTTQAQRKLFFNLKKERDRLEQMGVVPDSKLLAKSLDVSESEVIEMEKRLAAPDASLNAPIGNDESGARTRMDMLSDEQGSRPDVEVEQSQFHILLREKLDAFAETLDGREETIFRDRWLTDTPLTLREIGERYGVSRERARQLEKRLLGRVRTYLETELGAAVDIDEMTRD